VRRGGAWVAPNETGCYNRNSNEISQMIERLQRESRMNDREETVFEEFKKFVFRGNVMDLAIAVVIGAAFGAIVASFVSDLIMPLIGVATGGVNFSNLYINLSGKSFESYKAAKDAGAAVLGYGAFITTVLYFLIIAWVIFVIVQTYNRFLAKPPVPEAPAAPTEPSAEEKLLTEIRDLLKQRNL
jgi:large conductance mechanosensitive channel